MIIKNLTENVNKKKENSIMQNHDYTEHKTLMDKVYKYGVCGIPYKLIKSYFTNRTQVKVTDVVHDSSML
jgi:hypothetical protein